MSGDPQYDPYVKFLKRLDETGILPKTERNMKPDEKRDIHAKRAYHINAAAQLEAAEIIGGAVDRQTERLAECHRNLRKSICLTGVFAGVIIGAAVVLSNDANDNPDSAQPDQPATQMQP